MNTPQRTLAAITLAALASLSAALLQAGTIIKANNIDPLNQTTSWVGGAVPGAGDIATWNSTVAANTVSLGANQGWLGLAVDSSHTGNITVNTGNTLTLGAAGLDTRPNITFTLNNAIALGAAQTWYAGSGILIPAGGVNTAGFTLTLDGAVTKQFKGAITGGGNIVVIGGTMQLTGVGVVATASAVAVNPGATLFFDKSRGNNTRAASVTLNAATLSATGDSLSGGIAQKDRITGALTLSAGGSTVTLTPSATGYEQVFAGSLVRTARSTVLFRGTSLGVNSIASLTLNSANVDFTTAPALVGASTVAGSTTNSILVGAYGDTTTGGNGMGLVTYDSTYGVRLLNTGTEYTAAVADGQTQLDNARLANSSGIPVTNTLNSATTVNSISFDVSGTAGSGIVINGSGALTPASGVVFGRQAIATATAADAMTIDGPTLNLGGNGGLVLFNTVNTGTSGIGGGPLTINSRITNDGGNGVVFRGSGVASIRGAVANDYTGDTVLMAGNLYVNKTVNNVAIPGNVVIYGGNLIDTGNEIADSADISIYGGALQQRASMSTGSGASETFRDLTLAGGTYNDGASGTSSGTTSMGHASVSGGTWNVTKGHLTTLSGALSQSGGTITLSSGDSTSGGRLAVSGLVSITNTLTAAFTCMTLGNNASSGYGARVFLYGDLTFVGNATNDNATVIAATAGNKQGLIHLNGTRTFSIDDGLAPTDLLIQPVLADNTTAVGGQTGGVAGSLVKTGDGTLALNGGNTFTGGTAVNDGALAGTGSLASGVTVAADAAIYPGAVGAAGTLTVTGNVSFASGAILRVDASGATADRLNVVGTISGGPVNVDVVGTGTGPWLIATATSITGAFTTDAPGLVASVRGGDELWLGRSQGTVLVLR